MKSTVLIMAGGTGGHVIPALSVAKQLKSQGYEVHWLGSTQGIENDLVPDAGYELHRIRVTGLRGKGALKLFVAPILLLKAVWQAYGVIRKVKPVLALGMGGFASGPGGFVAAKMGIPVVIHEQNAIPGMTNRLLSRWAHTVLQAFDQTFTADVKPKTVGNPVRQSIFKLPEPNVRVASHEGLNVLVVGGSLGAVAVNQVVVDALALMPENTRPNIWHQAGKRNYDNVKQAYDAQSIQAKVSAFIADMSEAYEWADVVICRSGALTVSELMAAGVASILVPFPHAVDDHQTANAQFLVEAGAARLRPQAELTPERLVQDLTELGASKESRLAMAMAARSLAKPEAARVAANYCIEAIHG